MQAPLLFVLLLGVSSAAGAQTPPPLWSIGESDGDTREFALAPAGYGGFREPGLFLVGASDPARDWPYVLPGPDDFWAPHGPHTFEVYFGLLEAPEAEFRLVLDFVDTHGSSPPLVEVRVNDQSWEFQTPVGGGDASVFGDPAQGREHEIAVAVPADSLVAGTNRVEITARAGSWALWDALWMEAPRGVRLAPVESRTDILAGAAGSPAILRRPEGPAQPVTLTIRHVGLPTDASLTLGDAAPMPLRLVAGRQRVEAHVQPVSTPVSVPAVLRSAERELARTTVELEPVVQREIHLIHQTHLDIGYTHTQDVVLQKQIEYLHQALQYIEETKDYPEEARFVWHPEGMWAVDEFMRIASEEEKQRFVAACRARQIHLDVLYAQAMTGMYTEEELFELMGAAKRFEAEHGVPIDSAMQSDVPGYTWGLAAALAHHGVKHISIGPNHFHRMGYTFEWGDKPFWWVDPSGQHRVLFWMCGDGYAYFHSHELNATNVFAYIDGLERKDYPYSMSLMRYCIGGDNGPPRRELSDFVRDWNQQYVTPRLVIARNSAALEEFARRYGDELPVLRGDFSPYWEDGSASTALATGVNRRACEQIAQTQTLWALLSPDLALHAEFDAAWTKMIMYDEHTWGAHNSISAPDDEFAIRQDEYKQRFALDGAARTSDLLRRVTHAAAPGTSNAVQVYNSASWPRSGLVLLSAEVSSAGDRVLDAAGVAVPSQRLASGELALLAADVPALGSRRYSIHEGAAAVQGEARAEGRTVHNALLRAEVDPETGAIRSLRDLRIDVELVDQERGGLNDYLYILGRDPAQGRATIEGPVEVVVEDPGPLVATLRVESDAPGCRRLTRRLRLVHGFDHLELINTADKLQERQPEGLYFSFPFQMPDPTARIDVPWTVVEVETDQMVGANRNFYCVQRFVELSNEEYGLTWVPVDAPMVQFDPIQIAEATGRRSWRTHIDPDAYLHSWTMNNHWETNYKADQEGIISFTYALRPHAGGYDPVASQRFGREICQPLLVMPVGEDSPSTAAIIELAQDSGVVVTSLRPSRDGEAFMVRLFNVSNAPVEPALDFASPDRRVWVSNPMEVPLRPCPTGLQLGRHEILTLRVER